MRNFMSYDRRWLDEPHMGDHVGRTVWALGEILATAWIPAVVEPTRDLLDRLVERALGRRVAAHGGLRASSASPASTPTVSIYALAGCSSASSTSSPTPTIELRRRIGAGSRTGSPTTTPGSRRH